VSFATDGDTEDLGPILGRRPISVAALLEREGFRPTQRSKATRRALSGVAAGAVLALGAVVGSLLINHGATNTTGDTLASGGQSGGDIVLAESGAQPSATPGGTSTTQATTPSSVGATRTTHTTAPTTSRDLGGRTMTSTSRDDSDNSGRSGSANSPVTTTPSTGTTAPSTQSAPTTTNSAPTTTQSAPTSGTTSNTTASGTATATSTPSTSTPPSSTTAPITTPSSGGLLGGVAGSLNSVTAPVFNWFN
jgi:hypothetical protein